MQTVITVLVLEAALVLGTEASQEVLLHVASLTVTTILGVQTHTVQLRKRIHMVTATHTVPQ